MSMTQHSAQPIDPLVTALDAYVSGLKAYRDAPEPLTVANEEVIIATLVKPHQNLLQNPGKVQSAAGALALVQYLTRDNEDWGQEAWKPLLASLEEFLGEAERKTVEQDPVHAKIDNFLAVKELLNRFGFTDDEHALIFRIYDERLKALGEFRPTTPEGERRLLAVLFVEDSDNQLEMSLPFFRALMGYANRHLGMELEWPGDLDIVVTTTVEDLLHGRVQVTATAR